MGAGLSRPILLQSPGTLNLGVLLGIMVNMCGGGDGAMAITTRRRRHPPPLRRLLPGAGSAERARRTLQGRTQRKERGTGKKG